jgi:bacillithiol biosynthesis cysteine-adding enzyme BshC
MASLFSSYVTSGLRASAFFPSELGTREGRVARVRAAARPVAPSLLQMVRDQNAWFPSDARSASIDALGAGAAAVVTGQQVGLFLGPLYAFYKAATAVVLARALEAESGVRCVPIFWLQTEDHDFAEIARCRVASLELKLPADEARICVAERRLPSEIPALVGELRGALGELLHADETAALLAAWYRPGEPLARAFAGVLASLYPELVLIDPRDPTAAELARPVLRRAIVEADAIDAALAAQGRALRAAGFDEQVRPRPGCSLAFFHPDGEHGPRFRLERDGDAWRAGDHVLDERALLDELERAPLSFSTSALLRPLVEDTLLPTAAYVGGPAEVAYFAQLAPLWARFELAPPLVAPRARFRLIPPIVRRLLDGLALAPADLELPLDELEARVAPRDGTLAPEPSWLAELDARLDAFAAVAEPRLQRDAARAKEAARRGLARLIRRHRHTLLARDATRVSRLSRLREWLAPDGKPQERVHSLAWFAAYAGPRALVERVCAAIDPFHPTVVDLSL